MEPAQISYRGRFAPSPTGPLHFGSLLAAVASYLEARRARGEWLVRIEDLDPPREVPGASDLILHTLDTYGLYWDGDIRFQSERHEAYAAALDRLRRIGATYPCGCTRKDIAHSAALAGKPGIYPGTCRAGLAGRRPRAIRLRTDNQIIRFTDRILGQMSQDLEREVGDFVLRRADGLFAYQLAVVVDDADQNITDVVRGSDLLESTPRQILLQRLLGLPRPDYAHLPVAVDGQGEKLSKQTHARPLDIRHPVPVLWRALHFLGQRPPTELRGSRLDELWQWALDNWDSERIPRRTHLPEITT